MSEPIPQDYGDLLGEIKERIRSARYEALRKVNSELISLYWDIGEMILGRQSAEGWGKSVVENLAADLQAEFPGIGGFSAANLWRMRLFYDTYADNEKLAPLVREIAWSHNLLIMEKCKDDLEREFYLRMTRKLGWTKNVLVHQIENKTYEKTMLGQTNFEETLPEEIRVQARLAVKDEYTFDENPSIGIILCKSRNKTIVEYALRESTKPIGVASYRIVSTLPEELKGQLPAPEQVSRLMESL
jgi:predicted nuclease of restriction endonuclease-like (RecB) superfamily